MIRYFLTLLLATAFVTAGHCDERPNILFVMADDLGWGDVGCYGNAIVQTPNIDAIAEAGVLCTQYYCAAPSCSPNRASILSGRFPTYKRVHVPFSGKPPANQRYGQPNYMSNKGALLSRLLKQAGYTTGYYGKWHLGSRDAPPLRHYAFQYSTTFLSSSQAWAQAAEDFPANIDRWITDEAIEFIESTPEPWFSIVSFATPHAPLNPTAEQLAVYDHLQPARYPHPGALQIYYAAITEMDTQVGRLLDSIPPNTLVVFTSDNGPASGLGLGSHHRAGSAGPFRGTKQSLYEGGIRVPLVAALPGVIDAGTVTSVPICSVDLLPTFVDWAQDEESEPPFFITDGENMRDALCGHHRERETTLFWENRRAANLRTADKSPHLAMREGKYKLLANADGSRKELYDMSTTLGMREVNQVDNLSVRDSMFSRLRQWSLSTPRGPRDENAGSNEYPFPMELTN